LLKQKDSQMETKSTKTRRQRGSRLGVKAPQKSAQIGSSLGIKQPTEGQIGSAFYKWWSMAYRGMGVPSPALLFHIANEGSGGNPIRGAILKRQGVVKGVPDYLLAVPRGKFHGLFIELKTMVGKTSQEQEKILCEFSRQGYSTHVCFGFDQAVRTVECYLKSE
jgi:hypothetical protein